jgi:hypothetical protein
MEIDIQDLQSYIDSWQGIARFYEPKEIKVSAFKKAMREMSEALKEDEHKKALARVAMARDRIERVKRGEDAGLPIGAVFVWVTASVRCRY